MAEVTDRRLTLVATHDDLVRNAAILTEGIEPEFLKFVQNQEECRIRWLESHQEMSTMKKELKRLMEENNALETKLKHARGYIDHEMKKRKRAEDEKETLSRQIGLVRELLTDKNNKSLLNDNDRERLAFLSYQPSQLGSPYRDAHNPHMSTIEEPSGNLLSDDEYDKTKEDDKLEPTAPPLDDEPPPGKRVRHTNTHKRKSRERGKNHRRSRSAVVANVAVSVTPEGPIDASAEISADRRRRNSSPGKSINKGTEEDYYNANNNARTVLRDANSRSPGSPVLRRYGSAGRGLNRPHVFTSKTVIRPETCQVCSRRVRFGKLVMKCKDCRASAHPECKEQVPLPCIPATPITPRSDGKYELKDFTTSEPPMIPALVIHCVNEVESRGLNEVGLYRLSGSKEEVKDLRDRFMRGRGMPNLSNVNDIHVICSCLKDFLRGLRDPLLTRRLWQDFHKAAEITDRDERLACIYQAVSQLPQPNRDTLAFLIIHLQRVAESPECQMPATNLAKIFGPTIMGYSTAEPEPMQMMDETRKQPAILNETNTQNEVILRLLEISPDYWTSYINIDDDHIQAAPIDFQTPQTPEITAVPQSMLGPVFGSGYDSTERTLYTTRTGNLGLSSTRVRRNPRHFFDSPKV